MSSSQVQAEAQRRIILHAGGDASSAAQDIIELVNGARNAVFVPYAMHDWDTYTASMQQRRFDAMGIHLRGVHTFDDPAAAIRQAEAIIVGGGNSFRLVAGLHRYGLIEAVQSMVATGVPYFGGSAGANVGAPTIRTTNDMPIVEAPSLSAFGFVPFQINPHYVDPPPPEARVGETRVERLTQFLEENDVPVVALREGSWIRILGDRAELRGQTSAVLLRRGEEPVRLSIGEDLSCLLAIEPNFDSPIVP